MTLLHTLKKRSGTFVIAGLILIAVVVYLAITLPTASLSEPIENQLEAIRIEDNVTAYSYTSPAFQKATTLEQFNRFIAEYSSLRNNESIRFNQRDIKKGVGIVKATLTSRGGVETPVLYQLIKEKNGWKIESIVITPQSDDDAKIDAAATPKTPATTPVAANTAPAAPAAVNTPAPTTAPAENTASSTYSDPVYHYTVVYPSEWIYKADNNRVIFNGKPGSNSSEATFSIQPIDMPGNENTLSVQTIADQGEEAIKEKSGDYKVIEDGLLPPHSNKNENFHGKYALYSYTINNQPMKQLKVIYFKSPKHAQYVIDFIAPASQFDSDLRSAKEMIASFTIS